MIEKLSSDDELRRILEARAMNWWPEIRRAVELGLPLRVVELLMTRDPDTEPLDPLEDPWHDTQDRTDT